MPPAEDSLDSLSLLLGDDDAKGILEALAAIEDGSHQRACRTTEAFVGDETFSFGPVPPPPPAVVAQEQTQLVTAAQQHEDSKPAAAATEYKKPCHPYFYYRDFSTLPDPDPASPITAPGRIPNFPAKMYAILSRKDLADIITWMPHGRSWKVLKPREFEVKVIPTYFEHAKFSSFIRQANGWGFRRIISKGNDRNSYYHELFLRGRPHLIKLMRRPPPSSKPLADASTEPDFYAVSEDRPLPEIKDGDSGDIPQNFPRQATYSFVPPPAHLSQPPPTTQTQQHQAPQFYQQPPVASQHPAPGVQQQQRPAGGPVDISSPQAFYSGESVVDPYSIYKNPVHPPPQVQQQQQQYTQIQHYEVTPPPPPQQAARPRETSYNAAVLHHDEVLSSLGPSIHHVDSTDSLMDLIKEPLPLCERFGTHTFISLFD